VSDSPATTTLVAPEGKKAKLVKIKLVHPCMIKKDIVGQPGEVHDVAEEKAAELCDQRFPAGYNFGGERMSVEPLTSVARAVRVG
jgi:hypothetical protein